MRIVVSVVFALASIGVGHAGDLDIHVLLSGQIAPGVYGQVQLGNERPPPLVYERPMLIEPQAEPPPPIYLHVPPGHAKNWRKHCGEYHACGRPVYFVRSEEYDPGYVARDHERERDEARRRWEDHERDESRDRDRDHGQRRDRDEDHDHGRDRHDER